jgi:hypothetical protein
MKGKKLGKQSQHVRRVATKRGVKRVMINPGVRKKVVRKRMVGGPERHTISKVESHRIDSLDNAKALHDAGILSKEKYSFFINNKDDYFGKEEKYPVFIEKDFVNNELSLKDDMLDSTNKRPSLFDAPVFKKYSRLNKGDD